MFHLAAFATLVAAASAAEWKIVNSTVSSVETGIAFTSATVGYAAGAGSGLGPEILKTTDGGVTWTVCPAQFGADFLLTDTDAVGNTVVVTSVLGELYSLDAGKTFQPSTGGGSSQSVRYIGTDGEGALKFGVTGQYGLFTTINGVGISVDGGKSFKVYDANMQTLPRYGAFPTNTTWYVAGGTWPGEVADDDQPIDDQPTDDLPADGKAKMTNTYRRKPLAQLKPQPRMPKGYTSGYQAQITKTEDGGATFKSVFNVSDQFYFNAIDCLPNNPNWCCAVGDALHDSATPGARVLCTHNGGSTWNQTYIITGNTTVEYSLIEIRFNSQKEAWAVGGMLTPFYPATFFLHSLDGGQTWKEDPTSLEGYYVSSLSVVNSGQAFAGLQNFLFKPSAIAAYE